MSQISDLSRSLAAFDQNTALTVVVELSEASWLVAGLVPGLDRQPLKKQEPIRWRCSGCWNAGGPRR